MTGLQRRARGGVARVRAGTLGLPTATLVVLCAAILAPSSAAADVVLVEKEGGSFTLGGYVRSTSGVQTFEHWRIADDLLDEAAFGSNVGVGRLEWTGTVGDRLTVDLHQRVLWRVQAENAAIFGTGLGVGVSRPPDGNVDLSTVLIDTGQTYAEHDIDRLSLRIYLDRADLYIGRQAIGWGNALLFPVADVWTRFSPFELDTAEKRGVDALRVILAPSYDWELEFVAVDRGAAEDIGAGVRATFYRPHGDVYVASAKTYNEVFWAGGWARDMERITFRGEAMLPLQWGDDGASLELPRATLGIDHFRDDWIVSAEAHFNGAGETHAEDYVANAGSADVYQRAEVYLLGRYYAGGTVAYTPTELTSIGVGAMMNLSDPSAILTPTFAWQVAQDVEFGLGGFIPIGAQPEVELILPRIRSEFGSAPYFAYANLAAYY